MEVTIALSLGISWASYASDLQPVSARGRRRAARCSGCAFAGLMLAYTACSSGDPASPPRQRWRPIGRAEANPLGDGGGGLFGALAPVVIALGSIASNAMNDYSGSLALQTVGVKVRRPVSAAAVAVIAFALIMWLHAGDLTERFQGVLLFIGFDTRRSWRS